MLDLSVSNLAGAVAEKNQNLVAIKGLIVLQNISELEKSLEENNNNCCLFFPNVVSCLTGFCAPDPGRSYPL